MIPIVSSVIRQPLRRKERPNGRAPYVPLPRGTVRVATCPKFSRRICTPLSPIIGSGLQNPALPIRTDPMGLHLLHRREFLRSLAASGVVAIPGFAYSPDKADLSSPFLEL